MDYLTRSMYKVAGFRSICGLVNGIGPLDGARITASFITDADPYDTLSGLGAKVRFCYPDVLPSRDAFLALKDENLQEHWERIDSALDWGDGVIYMIADAGGDITHLLQEGIKAQMIYEETGRLPDPSSTDDPNSRALLTVIRDGLTIDPNRYRRMVPSLAGISQVTSTGVVKVLKIRDDGTLFEPFSIYDSTFKTKYENWYGSHLSMPEGLKRATGEPIANKNVVLWGYGDVGKDCADDLKEAGANVFVVKNDPKHAIDALIMEGHDRVKTPDEIVSVGDIFISTTDNKDIITVDYMKKMKNNATVLSIGKFDNDIDMQGVETYPDVWRINVSPIADKWVFPETNNGVIVLADGRMINLGCATGNPRFVDHCPNTDQIIGLIELWKQKGAVRDA